MRALVQRVSEAFVKVDGKLAGQIGRGLVIFVGVRVGDSAADANLLATRVCRARIFPALTRGKELSVQDINGQLLIVSQFTLYAETTKGNRPSYARAAGRETAEPLYQQFIDGCRKTGLFVATGWFGADMNVSLQNEGPVTLLYTSDKQELH